MTQSPVDDAPAPAQVRGAGFWIRRIVGVIVGLILAVLVWDGIHAFIAYDALINAEGDVKSLEVAVSQNQFEAFPVIYADMKSNTATAAGATSDPIWRATEAVPVIGSNLGAFRQVSSTVNQVVVEGIGPLAAKAKGLNIGDFRPKNGQIDMARIESFIPAIDAANKGLLDAQKSGNAIDTSHDLPPVANAVEGFRILLEQGILDVAKVQKVVAQVPPALGSDGQRNYVVVVSDDSSDRANGGAASTLALVSITNGAIVVEKTTSIDALQTSTVSSTSAGSLPPFAAAAAGDILDAQRSADFPSTAETVATAWTTKYNEPVDGVIATDSEGFSYLTNAAALKVSATPAATPAVVDSTLASALAGKGATAGYLSAASRLFKEHRILVWVADKDLQKTLATTSLAGTLAKNNTSVTTYGVFLNQPADVTTPNARDITVSAKLTPALCTAPTQKRSQIAVTLKSTSATSEDVLVYGPANFTQGGFTVAGAKATGHMTAIIDKRPVEVITLSLPANVSVTLTVFHTVGGATPSSTTEIRTSPRWEVTPLTYAPCG